MKKNICLLLLFIAINTFSFTEEKIIYTFFLNSVPNSFPFPLIGIVNVANGNHNIAQIGFYNWNKNNFIGYQAGFINLIGKDLYGVQTGFINKSSDDAIGWQAGFINMVGLRINGVQTGFVNNSSGNMLGWQAGFINKSGESTVGSQIGFINITSKKMTGVQLGFLNYADSLENGIPIGFISIVRNGGYQAIEYSFSELYPINVALKLGVNKFYTSIIASYNPFIGFDINYFAIGIGFGSIFQIGNRRIFFNPEINELWRVTKSYQTFLSFAPNIGYNITDQICILLSPSITWMQTQGDEWIQKPFFQFFENKINENHSIFFGIRTGIRFQL